MNILNPSLLKQQKISPETQVLIENLHISMQQHHARPLEDITDIQEYIDLIQEIEFAMQRLWGFPEDRSFHTHWYHDPKCSCPTMDNDERQGYSKYVTESCPLHGNLFG